MLILGNNVRINTKLSEYVMPLTDQSFFEYVFHGRNGDIVSFHVLNIHNIRVLYVRDTIMC